MSDPRSREAELEARIRELEEEVARLQGGFFAPAGGNTVQVPEPLRALFRKAEETVDAYFRDARADPAQGTIEIAGERYLLVRASALSYGFVQAIRTLYADRAEAEALHIAKTLLFDIAHVLGINDARNFHRKMGVTDPIAKLSAGPVHFAYAGWAFVEILPESRPTPDEDYFLHYRHPYSFESDSWLRAGVRTDFPVCVMNAGYSSGWCEESFGLPLSSAEITCKAKGDEHCAFVMAPPHRLTQYVERALATAPEEERLRAIYAIPTFFERKDVEKRLRDSVERAEAANEAKSVFLANMSHEIRTPLTGVLGMAQLLLRRDLGPLERRYVETIEQSGTALLGILNAILDLSKIEAGMMPIRPEPTDVRRLLAQVGDASRPRAEEIGLVLSVDVDERVPERVRVDPLRLRQVVMNLTSNAVKFTQEGSVVLRAAWEEPETLCVEVEDTGIGVPEEQIPELFEMFTQADASDARRHGGTGLGLSIARRLVELMGGEIGARSRVGEGSTFYFRIPAPHAGAAEARRGPEVVPSPRFDARVLLVEDDGIARFVIEQLLKECGCEVHVAKDGREAVVAAATHEFDLILMDCQMQVMDGYEATARIRAQEAEGPRVPIVAMTASVMRSEGARCFAAGMDDFLGKPVDARSVHAVLARWTTGKPPRGRPA